MLGRNLVSGPRDKQELRRGSGLIKKMGGKATVKKKDFTQPYICLKIPRNGQIVSLDFSMKSLLEERNVLSGFDNK